MTTGLRQALAEVLAELGAEDALRRWCFMALRLTNSRAVMSRWLPWRRRAVNAATRAELAQGIAPAELVVSIQDT